MSLVTEIFRRKWICKFAIKKEKQLLNLLSTYHFRSNPGQIHFAGYNLENDRCAQTMALRI